MPKLFLILIVVLVIATAAYAFAASNTVPASYAGEGSAAISGYTVTNLVYTLNATNASNIDAVSFTLNAAATNVQASLVPGTFYNCTNTSGNNWSCTTTAPQATVLAASTLNIIARDH
jgi:hypothetical protein